MAQEWPVTPWWRHDVETFSALLYLFEGNHHRPTKVQKYITLMFSELLAWPTWWTQPNYRNATHMTSLSIFVNKRNIFVPCINHIFLYMTIFIVHDSRLSPVWCWWDHPLLMETPPNVLIEKTVWLLQVYHFEIYSILIKFHEYSLDISGLSRREVLGPFSVSCSDWAPEVHGQSQGMLFQ